jgi:putative ABC transport system ATP-binding protein
VKVISLAKVTKRYTTRRGEVQALAGVDLEVREGEFVAIKGPSGSGKTTLLLAIGGMLRPTSGAVRVAGEELYSLDAAERALFRRRRLGFVFQMFHLVPYLDVLENVLLAADGDGAAVRGRACELLEELRLSHRLGHKPAELSAGERQRAAIARAMLNRPKLILADEPTGNLDSENAAEVFRILSSYHRQGGTVLVVTHGSGAEDHAGRTLRMEEGLIVAPAAGGGVR